MTATLAPATTDSAQPTGVAPVRLIKAELLKIWTTNTWWVFGILTLVFTGLALLINLLQAHSELGQIDTMKANPPIFDAPPGQPQPDFDQQQIAQAKADYAAAIDVTRVLIRNAANVYTSGQFFGLLFVVILGALIVTNEFHHQTATTTFLTTPHRTSVIVSKLAAGAVLAAGFWLLTTVIDLLVGSLFFSSEGYSVPLTDWPVVRSVLLNLLAFVIWSALGIGLGVLIRSQLGATLTGAVAYFLAGLLATALLYVIHSFVIKEDWIFNLAVLIPGIASQVMISPDPVQIGPSITGPAWWVGLLVLIGYGLLAALIGTLITRRRDIS